MEVIILQENVPSLSLGYFLDHYLESELSLFSFEPLAQELALTDNKK